MKNILIYFLIPIICLAQKNKSISNNIDNILSQMPQGSSAALFISNATTGDTIYSKNINKQMIPASNTKMFTTSAALYYLGKEHTIPFKILTDDIDISDGVIDGNLYLKGFGNSLLTYKILDSLITDLVRQGITKIDGDIVADDSFFDNIYTRDDWIVGERANVVLPPISALVLDRNEFIVNLFANKKVGQPLDCKLKPASSFAQIVMNAKVKSKYTRPRIKTSFNSSNFKITISRGIKKRRSPIGYRVFASDPAQYFAFSTYDLLISKGIEVTGKPIKNIAPFVNFELNQYSILLGDLIKSINKHSDNFLAECLFKLIGAHYAEGQGNSFYATKAVNTFLDENNIHDLNTSLVDGSGISRFDVMSAAGLHSLLNFDYHSPNIFPPLFNSLSIAGVDGTLEDRMLSSKAYNNFRGKTGTLNGVSTISGFATAQNGEDVIFVILMNFNRKGANYYRALQDEIIETVIENL